MRVHTDYLWFSTKQRREFVRITDDVARIVKESGVKEGMRVFVPGVLGAPGDDQRRICEIALTSQVQVRHLRPSIPTLEDVFARAVGER